ncbi:MAG: hypothetical protein IPO16_00950 [Saprospiraceae bacterium]|nr:hypothetical protein [Saprospiraceae bacterium]
MTINKKEPTSFSDSFVSVYFKHDNEFYPIEKYEVNIDFWIDYQEEDNPTSFQYFDITNNKLIANFFSKSIEIEAGIKGHLNLIELTETEEIKMDYVTENPSHQKNVKTHDFGTFQPGELKFEISKLEKKE